MGASKERAQNTYLVELMTDMMECLDDNRAATTYLSIDLSKAFNRMNHGECLKNLAKSGASTDTLEIVASFLERKKMRIKLPHSYSSLYDMPGGAPQGTKCGNLLFCVASMDLTTLKEEPEAMQVERDGSLGLIGLANRLASPDRASSPLGGSRLDLRYAGKRGWIEDSSEEEDDNESQNITSIHEPPPRWEDLPVKPLAFIDDITSREKVDTTAGESHITTHKEVKTLHARKTQWIYDSVVENAERQGMKVNQDKTQLLCMSTAINSEIRTYININGSRIVSGDKLKTLGFTLGRRPGAHEHVKALRRSFGARAGMLRHLKKANIEEKVLVQVYTCFIRPVLEYACPAFTTVLTGEQCDRLERLQRIALKIIYGIRMPYAEGLRRSGLETLATRRDTITKAFTSKAYESDRFRERWFKPSRASGYSLRSRRAVAQEFAARDRLVNAPIYKMREDINHRLSLEPKTSEHRERRPLP